MIKNPVYISLEFTPNPNTLKYSINQTLLEKSVVNITSKTEAERKSPLAKKLFEVEGISGVMVGRDFITVTKSDDGDWDLVHRKASSIIETHLNAGEAVVSPILGQTSDAQSSAPQSSELESKIQEVLDREIRPAVAMDGGDISLDRYEDGVVYLHLQGSCSGCPSSTMTLKMGIETRLKELFPEVKEVVSA